MDLATRGHHHSSSDGVQRVRSKTSTSGNTPAEQERGKEVVREVTGKEDGLERVVHAEVETTVDNDTDDRGDETTVETGDTVRGERLAVNVNETVELTLSSTLGSRLGVVGKTGTGVVERVDKEERRGTGGTTGSKVGRERLPVRSRLGDSEKRLEEVLEGKVESLGGEVTDDVSSVTTPEGDKTLLLVSANEAVANALVRGGETALLDHLILVLDEELDSLNGGSSSLGDSGGDTTHEEISGEATERLLGLSGVGNGTHFDCEEWENNTSTKEG